MTKQSIEKVFGDMAEVLVKKNSDYGGASFDLGLNGNMVHLWDKIRRYRNMVEKRPQGSLPNFESIKDTLMDTIGYAVIGLHILEAEEKALKQSDQPINRRMK